MTSAADCDVLVIGAGLAGLRCAGLLARHGLDVQIWEAADAVGGRVRTDVVDGFRCDRGFQVLNPAYPELLRAVDVSALDLQSFDPGVSVRVPDRAVEWVHPLRAPSQVPRMLLAGGLTPADLLSLARWAAPSRRAAPLRRGARDTTLAEALDRASVRGLPRRVVQRFLAGVVLEDRGETSNDFVLLLARLFVLGVPGLPSGGMQALPEQLAAPVRDRIRLGRTVRRIERAGQGWTVSDGTDTVGCRDVVVAADALAAAGLTGTTAPPTHGVVTDWWAADDVESDSAMLWVDGRPTPGGPVLNTSVISNAAPGYAPPGRHLIAASALLDSAGQAPAEHLLRDHAGQILGLDTTGWQPVVRHVIPHALPAQPPPLRARRPIRTADGMWLCGDHRDTASIQGALVSGRRVAETLLAGR